jgi:hypothetical protein
MFYYLDIFYNNAYALLINDSGEIVIDNCIFSKYIFGVIKYKYIRHFLVINSDERIVVILIIVMKNKD